MLSQWLSNIFQNVKVFFIFLVLYRNYLFHIYIYIRIVVCFIYYIRIVVCFIISNKGQLLRGCNPLFMYFIYFCLPAVSTSFVESYRPVLFLILIYCLSLLIFLIAKSDCGVLQRHTHTKFIYIQLDLRCFWRLNLFFFFFNLRGLFPNLFLLSLPLSF